MLKYWFFFFWYDPSKSETWSTPAQASVPATAASCASTPGQQFHKHSPGRGAGRAGRCSPPAPGAAGAWQSRCSAAARSSRGGGWRSPGHGPPRHHTQIGTLRGPGAGGNAGWRGCRSGPWWGPPPPPAGLLWPAAPAHDMTQLHVQPTLICWVGHTWGPRTTPAGPPWQAAPAHDMTQLHV